MPPSDHASGVIIVWTGIDGDEHEEAWPSAEAFRCWAVSDQVCCRFDIYQVDEDNDRVLIGRGQVGT